MLINGNIRPFMNARYTNIVLIGQVNPLLIVLIFKSYTKSNFPRLFPFSSIFQTFPAFFWRDYFKARIIFFSL